jgi:hypothetical protein
VLDPEELDRAPGPRGRLVVEVPAPWLAAGDAVEIVVPRRMTCARCEGGGCDDCGRSGALRLPADETARTLQLRLPVQGTARNVVRLVRPLGPEAGIEQLSVELRVAPEPSPFCQRLAPPEPTVRPSYAAALIALALALLLAAVLSLR